LENRKLTVENRDLTKKVRDLQDRLSEVENTLSTILVTASEKESQVAVLEDESKMRSGEIKSLEQKNKELT